MKRILQLMALLLCATLSACSSDEPNNPNDSSSNNSHVTIKADGSTSTGVVFSPIDETSFFLDYIKYKIVDSHLEIVGYDNIEISEHVKPYASVTYLGNTYNTRVIGPGAFKGSKIKAISFPDGLETINSGAFNGCTGLTSVSLPESLQSIGSDAFSGCTGLTSISLPESLQSIGSDAFSGCTGLTSISLPDGLETIYHGAFDGCTGLTSISLPESLQSIGSGAFDGCTGLTSVSLPDGLETIESGAFRGCTGLTSVSLPNGLKTIAWDAFYGCTGLTSVTSLATNPPGGGPTFPDVVTRNGTLYVPSASVDLYKKASGWRYFVNIHGI